MEVQLAFSPSIVNITQILDVNSGTGICLLKKHQPSKDTVSKQETSTFWTMCLFVCVCVFRSIDQALTLQNSPPRHKVADLVHFNRLMGCALAAFLPSSVELFLITVVWMDGKIFGGGTSIPNRCMSVVVIPGERPLLCVLFLKLKITGKRLQH